MQYNASTPKEFLDALEEDWRKNTLMELRALIMEKLPLLVEGINYKMLSYSFQNEVLLHLNAQKNYVSLYVGDAEKVDPSGDLLQGLSVGKGCIRFKKNAVVNRQKVGAFVLLLGKMKNNGDDTGC